PRAGTYPAQRVERPAGAAGAYAHLVLRIRAIGKCPAAAAPGRPGWPPPPSGPPHLPAPAQPRHPARPAPAPPSLRHPPPRPAPGLLQQLADLGKIEPVRTGQYRQTQGRRLEIIVSAPGDKRPADEGQVGAGIELHQLAHAVAEKHLIGLPRL